MINANSSSHFQQKQNNHQTNPTLHKQRIVFGYLLICVQIIVLVMFGLFVRIDPEFNDDESLQTSYPLFQDINVMILVGFGFLMAFIKTHQWSALGYTFMINAVVVQLYLLWKPFWQRVFHQSWSSASTQILIDINDFTAASYSVASILIAFGGVLGRVGPLDLLVIGLIGIAGYTLNSEIVYGQMKVLDAGGTTTIHVYGAYYGLVISAILQKMNRTVRGPSSSNHSKVIMVFGTFFLWMFWPSFNANYFPATPQERSLVIANTIYSLVGSCMGAFIINSFFRERFEIRNIMNSALAGGVVIGASSGLITTPTASISIGIGIGIVCTIGYRKLGPKLKSFLGLQDTCGINNLHGIPGIIGGIVSAIILGAYNLSPLDEDQQSYLPFSKQNSERTYTQQAAYQVGGTGCSLALGLIFGLITALILSCFYKNQDQNFFQDSPNFEIPSGDQKQKFLQTQFM